MAVAEHDLLVRYISRIRKEGKGKGERASSTDESSGLLVDPGRVGDPSHNPPLLDSQTLRLENSEGYYISLLKMRDIFTSY